MEPLLTFVGFSGLVTLVTPALNWWLNTGKDKYLKAIQEENNDIDTVADSKCIVCKERGIHVTFEPCCHSLMCGSCLLELLNKELETKCFICKASITSLRHSKQPLALTYREDLKFENEQIENNIILSFVNIISDT